MLKQCARELLPKRLQVPLKYYLNLCFGLLESEMELLPLLMRPGDRALDVGGNRGVYAYALFRLGVKVEVFEPNPACAKVLSAWSAGKALVELHAVALSDREGLGKLSIPVDPLGVEHDASASLEHEYFYSLRSESVWMRTLDSFAFEKICFIKIDVEGHEYKVIKGAEGTLRHHKPAVLVEVEQRHCQRPMREVFEALEGLGFCGFFFDSRRLKPLSKFDVSSDQRLENLYTRRGRYINNFLFLHGDRLRQGDYLGLFQALSDE